MSKSLRNILFIASITPLVLAQTSILPSSASNGFPQCAVGCQTLQSAAASCEADPSGQQSIIDSCFCQSALLANLKSNPSAVCGSSCSSSSDLSSLQTWYNNFCSSGGSTAGQTTTTTAAPTTTANTPSTTSAGAATASVSTTPSTTGDPALNGNQPQQGPWISNHWRWVIMIAAVIIGLILLTILFVCLKRRHRRRLDARRTPTPLPFTLQPSQLSLGTSGAGTRTGTMQSHRSRSGTMQSRSRGDMREVWGPHQHMAATRGWEYTNEGSVVERDPIEKIAPSKPHPTSRAPSGSLRGQRIMEDVGIKEIDANTLPTRRYDDDVGKPRSKRSTRLERSRSVKVDEKGAADAAAAAVASQKRHHDRQNR